MNFKYYYKNPVIVNSIKGDKPLVAALEGIETINGKRQNFNTYNRAPGNTIRTEALGGGWARGTISRMVGAVVPRTGIALEKLAAFDGALYINLYKGRLEELSGDGNHFDEGYIRLTDTNAGLGEIEDSLTSKKYAFMRDPSVEGGYRVDTESQYKSWKMMQVFSPDNVGTVVGLGITGVTQLKGVSKLGGLKYNPKKILPGLGKGTAKVPKIGHSTEWSKMTVSERKAFQHSYSRHHQELGLPKWQQSNAESLRIQFNTKVKYIREVGKNDFFRSQELVNGVKQTVYRTEPIIEGQKYFYYETLNRKFVSVGKMISK